MYISEFTQENEQYKNFRVTKHLYIEEIQSYFTELTHLPSGATVVHIGNEDPENLFCISFPTYPTNSHGVPHILEHLVLCGSKKFPIKDPFFSMLRRSLNTFMNAMTGADFTCYPASSQVEKDFYNLLEVYLDAVFHPLLHKLSFLQEGYRLEFSHDKKATLRNKGVVFNEMKGAYSSPQARLWKATIENLTPNLPYGHDSGGDPHKIPEITYEELKDFHSYYYHPSHATFFFYGNLSLKKHLDFIEEKTLFGIEKIAPIPPLPSQKRFNAPKMLKESYPIAPQEPLEKKTMFSFAWLTAPLSEQKTILALTLLDAILMDNDASPLRFALLQSGLCTQIQSYLDTEMSEAAYVIICHGCNEKDLPQLQKILQTTLKKIVQEKIPSSLIEASMHQLEFNRSEISSDEYPYGLTLFFRSVLAMQHGADPENGLMIHSLFAALKKELKKESYLPSLIQKYYLKNPHFLSIAMVPDPSLATQEQKEEENRLHALQKKLSEKESRHILEQTKALNKYQKELETKSIECLPKISLYDVPPHVHNYPLLQETQENTQLFFHETFTNKITYIDLNLSLPNLDQEFLGELFFLSSILFQVGSKNRSYQETLAYIQSHIGGIGTYLSRYILTKDPTICSPGFHIRGKVLDHNISPLFTLIKDHILSADFSDKNRIKELLYKKFTHMQNTIAQNALSYAITLAQNGMDVPSYLSYRWMGLSYYYELKNIIENIDQKLPLLIDKLQFIHQKIFHMQSPDLIITSSSKAYNIMKKNQFFDLPSLPSHPLNEWTGNYSLPKSLSQARMIASPVAFTCCSYNTVGYTHKHAPALLVATTLLTNTHLHKKIREEGGAYGSGAHYSPTSGKFYFFAYRDPHVADTLEAFQQSVKKIISEDFSLKDLEEAKLGILQHMDAPISPGSRAITAYAWHKIGKTLAMREAFRKKIIDLGKEDIIRALKEQIFAQIDQGIIVTFGDQELLHKENQQLAKKNGELSIFPV